MSRHGPKITGETLNLGLLTMKSCERA